MNLSNDTPARPLPIQEIEQPLLLEHPLLLGSTYVNNLRVPDIHDEIVVFFFGTGVHETIPTCFCHTSILPSSTYDPVALVRAITETRTLGTVTRIFVKVPYRLHPDPDPLRRYMSRIHMEYPNARIPMARYYYPQCSLNPSINFVQDFVAFPLLEWVATITHQLNPPEEAPAVATVVGMPCVANDVAEKAVVFFFGMTRPRRHAEVHSFITAVKFSVVANIRRAMGLAFQQSQVLGVVYHVAIRVPEYEVLRVAEQIEEILREKLPFVPAFDTQSYEEAGDPHFTAFQHTRTVLRGAFA